jgi:glycosyltransferase involved in cell wall biosynthesis
MDAENIPRVSIIVPARNEEACLDTCLQSLVAQTGIAFEIIVVDDASTDRTAEIAHSFSNKNVGEIPAASPEVSTNRVEPALQGSHPACSSPDGMKARPSVTVISAPPLPDNWTGKNNAMSTGAKIAKGKWLLFTDADTVHKPGSLARAVAEAEQHGAALLSYSPEQEVRSFWEKAVMPVIFAELAATYPPTKVNDPASPIAAANGQYLLISREVYDAVGGHTKIASDLLEDVAMAHVVKSSGRKIFFRYGGDAVRTRMYRSWAQMKEGWTKNLALLFPSPWFLAIRRWGEFVSVLTIFLLGIEIELLRALGESHVEGGSSAILLVAAIFLALIWIRIRRAHFPVLSTLLAFIGLPLFAFLLIRSASAQRFGVMWKDRRYARSIAQEQGPFPRVLNAAFGTVQSFAVVLMTVIFVFVFYLVVLSSRELLLAQRH